MSLRERRMPHLVPPPPQRDLTSTLHLMLGGRPFSGSRLELMTEGEDFFQAELEAIEQARHSIELESYIFHDDEMGSRFLKALTERARAGVAVRLLLDAAGNWHVARRFYQPLERAGGRVYFFRSFSSRRVWWAIYRSHRDLLVLDGQLAFLGGAGIADDWMRPRDGTRPWQDCVVRVEGDAVGILQAMFRRAWVEQTRELLLVQPAENEPRGAVGGVLLDSKPSAGSPAGAYLALQALFSLAEHDVDMITPYFVPPPGLRKLLCELAGRGVRLRMLLPGDNSDHLITRAIARVRYGELLRAGIEIYEYLPTMHHGKMLVADRRWTAVGSVNLDYRSLFRHEELLLLADNEDFARTAHGHFKDALARSRRVRPEEWRGPGLTDLLVGSFARLIESHL